MPANDNAVQYYQYITISESSSSSFEEAIHSLGQDEWRLHTVHVVPSRDNALYYFGVMERRVYSLPPQR